VCSGTGGELICFSLRVALRLKNFVVPKIGGITAREEPLQSVSLFTGNLCV
jgi:hypothetical protein